MLLCVRLGAPLFAAAVLTIAAAYGIMRAMKLTLPPAAAIAILADLIPQEALPHFPAQIACGIAGLVLLSFAFRRSDRKAVLSAHTV